jgi:hypothetical protein
MKINTPQPTQQPSETMNVPSSTVKPFTISMTEEQLNALLRKATSDVLESVKELIPTTTASPARQLTLKEFIKLNHDSNPFNMGRVIVNAFLNANPDSILYQEMYDFFFKYRIGEALIRHVMNISRNVQTDSMMEAETQLESIASLTEDVFTRIGTIVLEQSKFEQE